MEFRSLVVLILSTYVAGVVLRRANGADDPSDEGGRVIEPEIQTMPECDSLCVRDSPHASESHLTPARSCEHSCTSVQSISSVSCRTMPQNYSERRLPRTSATSAPSVVCNRASPQRGSVSAHSYSRKTQTGVLLNNEDSSSPRRAVSLPETGRLRMSSVTEGATPGLTSRNVHRSPSLKRSASFPDDLLRRSDLETPVLSKLFSSRSRTYRHFEGPQISSSNPVCSPGREREAISLPLRFRPGRSSGGWEESSSCGEQIGEESPPKRNPLHLPSSDTPAYSAGRQQLRSVSATNTSQRYGGTTREHPACTGVPKNPASSPPLCKCGEDVHRSPSDRCPSMFPRQSHDESSSMEKLEEDSLATNSISVVPPYSTSSCKNIQHDSVAVSEKSAAHNPGGLLVQLLNNLISEDGTTSDEDAQKKLFGTQCPGSSNRHCQLSEESRDPNGSAASGTEAVRKELFATHGVASGKEALPSLSDESHSAAKSEPTRREKLLGALRRSRLFRADVSKREDTNNDGPNPTKRSTFSHFPSSQTRRSEVTSRPPSVFRDFPASAGNPPLSSFLRKDTSPSLRPAAPPVTTPPTDVLLARLTATRRLFRPFQDLSQKRTIRIRPQRVKPTASVSVVSGADTTTSLSAGPEAHARSDHATQTFRPEDDTLWTELRRYEHGCADTLLQQELGRLTLEVRDLVDTMKQDSFRQGPCFQDPEICEKLRPQMRCPCSLRFIGAEDLTGLASKAPQSPTLSTPDKLQAHVLEALMPTGKETKFTSLVSGRMFALKRTGVFRLESSLYLMVMEDAKGQQTFLEVDIVDCNEMNEHAVVQGKILRLQAIKQLRKQSSLKINAITEATGLSAVEDIWTFKFDEETVTRYTEKDSLYSVIPFVKVKRPWLTDLATLVVLLNEEAFQTESQQRVYVMRLNLTVQILTVVCCLDTHGVLPESFKLRHFALSPRGTIMYLLPPSFEHVSETESASGNVVVPHRSRFSLARMLTTVWCSSKLDYQRLSTISDWRTPEQEYFEGCVPEMPAKVKDIIVGLCASSTVNLYDFLEKEEFQSLLRSVQSIPR